MENELIRQDLSLAERNELLTRQYAERVRNDFIKMGMLLCENYDRAYWSEHHESFPQYVESLGIGSYSWVTRLMGIARLVARQLLSEEEASEIGVTKAVLLLSPAKEGRLSPELIEMAKNAPYRDLREEIGYKQAELEREDSIICPRCGAEIHGAKWSRKGAEQGGP